MPYLEEIVVKRLLTHTNEASCLVSRVLERPLLAAIGVPMEVSVDPLPLRHLADNLSDHSLPLLDALEGHPLLLLYVFRGLNQLKFIRDSACITRGLLPNWLLLLLF